MALAVMSSLVFAGCGRESSRQQKAEETTNQTTQETTKETNEVAQTNVEEQSKSISIAHEYGEVEVPRNPQAVMVGDMGILDILDRLEVDAVAAVPQDSASSIPSYLDEYKGEGYLNSGTLFEPNFELLYELSPDIMFISGRLSSQYEELSKIAPVVYTTIDNSNYIQSVENNLTLLGNIFEKEEEAKVFAQAMKEQANAIKEAAKESTALVIMVNKGDISAFGKGSRFGAIYDDFGFEVVDHEIEEATHGQAITFEYLAKVNPDYLFVVDRNAVVGESQTAEEVLDNPIVAEMDAAKQGNIVYLDPFAWYVSTGGVTSTEIMIQDVKNGLGIE